MDHTTTSTLTGGSQMRVRKLMLGTAMVSLFALPAMAQAAEVKLADALNRFASEADVEVLFSSDVGETKITDHVTYSGDAGNDLDSLLEDTGLRFEEPRPGVFIVALLEAPKVPSVQGRLDEAIRTAPVTTRADTSPGPDMREAQAQPTSTPAPDLEPVFNLDVPTGVITGQVVDAFSGQPLAGAFVVIEGSGRATSTDTRGFYRISAAPAGSYSLSVNYIGATFKSQRVTVESGGDVEANFSLSDSVDDQIVVYANRSALQQALNLQRAASNSSTVVSADLMGDFPAENIAEALRRVSGVTFSRNSDTGEGDRISVRGFNDQAINIQLNGIDLQGTGLDRGVDLSGFLTDNIKQVTIQKSLLPSMEATGSGGLVEIETRSGLDYGEKYLNLGAEWQSPLASGFGDEMELSATGAYQLSDDFGVSATVQYRESSRNNFNANILQDFDAVLPAGATSLFRTPESFDFPFDPEFSAPLYYGANYFTRARESENLTTSINAAYDWSDHTRLRLDLQQIKSDVVTSQTRSTQSFSRRFTNAPIPELGGEVRRRRYLAAFQPTLGLDDNAENLTVRSISFRGETDVNNWEFDYKAGFSKTELERENSAISFSAFPNGDLANIIDPSRLVTNPDSLSVDRVVNSVLNFEENGIPTLALTSLGQAYADDPASYHVLIASQADAVDTSENIVLEMDARRYFNSRVLDYIEVGGKYEDRTRNNSDDILSTTNLNDSFSFVRIFGQETFLSDLDSSAFTLASLSNIGLDNRSVPSLVAGSGRPIIERLFGFVEDDPSTPENEARFRLNDRRGLTAQDSSGATTPAQVGEEIIAGYVEGKIDVNKLEVIGGVRYQREERSSRIISAPSVIRPGTGVSFISRDVFAGVGLIDFLDFKAVQETLTPSVIANYRPNDEVVVRGAYFRSTVHPTISLLARPTNIFLDLRTGRELVRLSEPNPDLDPTVTDNFDLDVSYYFKDNPGLIRLGVFYKDLDNNFTQFDQPIEPTDVALRERVLDLLAPLAQVDPALLDFPDTTEYFLARPRNGEGGEVYGVEAELIRQIDFLGDSVPTWVENFSVLGNVTYTKSKFTEVESARNDAGEAVTLEIPAPFAGQSEWAGNASLRYEDGRFSGSVIYTYQSASASDFNEFNINGITPSFETLDARLSYQIDAKGNRPRMIFYVEGDDLLRSSTEADIRSAISSQFVDGAADFFFPESLQFNGGRRITVGARMTF